MGWRFRKSFTVIPGLRLNLSQRGLSASIGGAPFTVNIGPDGLRSTASIPGTGISYRHHISSSTPSIARPDSLYVEAQRSAPVEQIRSANTESLTSYSLQDLKLLLMATQKQRDEIGFDLAITETEHRRLSVAFLSWKNGFLLKRLFPTKFANRKAFADDARAKVQELQEQLRLSSIATQLEIDKGQAEPYYRMRDEFAALTGCAATWGIIRQQASDRVRERTTADSHVDRVRVPFAVDSCDLIQWEQKVPHMKTGNGGDIYLYPGFILYRIAKEAFSVIASHELRIHATLVEFYEGGPVPKGSQIIRRAWAKENKCGSRDRRFSNNYQIPVVMYGRLSLKSSSGLWEEFLFSAPEALNRFIEAWQAFESSFAASEICSS